MRMACGGCWRVARKPLVPMLREGAASKPSARNRAARSEASATSLCITRTRVIELYAHHARNGQQAAAYLIHHVGSQEWLAEHGKIVFLAERFLLPRQNRPRHHDDQHLRHGLQEFHSQFDAVA